MIIRNSNLCWLQQISRLNITQITIYITLFRNKQRNKEKKLLLHPKHGEEDRLKEKNPFNISFEIMLILLWYKQSLHS